MTEVRTFRAASMQEALDLVRIELGPDAVILHTREITHRRFLPIFKPRREVEITAGLGVNVRPAATSPAKRVAAPAGVSKGASSAGPKSAASAMMTAPPRRGNRLDISSEPSEDLATLLRAVKSQTANTPPARQSNPSARPKPSRGTPFGRVADHGEDLLGVETPSTNSSRRRASASAPPSAKPQAAASSDDAAARLSAKLDAIHRMIEDLGRSGNVPRAEEVPGELFQLYTELIDVEIPEDLARDLVCRLKRSCAPDQLADIEDARQLLQAMVESEIRCCDPISPRPGQRKVVALVGATGVGKTTTIAKLAANFRLRDGIRMGLVTVDTYRIAAVEQLRTYAEIIDLPMKIVTSPQEMRRALDEFSGLDLVLIDTAGRSPGDELQIQELKSLLAEARVDEVHLVMSMTASLRHLESTARKFAAASATSLILTKLDEAPGLGSLLSIARSVRLPISYVTTGQGVPDDIEPARADRLARLVLGSELVHC
ncbi:MAG: flagellar biosynthesis protein FlhF [Planctomycetaceae bacterium]